MLNKLNKIYINDLGLRFSQIRESDLNVRVRIEMEVFYQLKSLGYEIPYGNNGEYEKDFVINKRIQRGMVEKNVQVTYRIIYSEETINGKFRLLESIRDNYEKHLITMDKEDLSRNGIKHINLKNF